MIRNLQYSGRYILPKVTVSTDIDYISKNFLKKSAKKIVSSKGFRKHILRIHLQLSESF
jgi:hypothetical protein